VAISIVTLVVIEGVRIYRMYRMQSMSIAQLNRMRSGVPSSPEPMGLQRKIASASADIQPIRGGAAEPMNRPPRHIQSNEQPYVTPEGSPVDSYGSLRLRDHITSCYRQALASEPVFAGKLSVSLQVDATGHVPRTALVPEPFTARPFPFPRAFLACVDAAARKLTFEVPKAGALVVLSYKLSVAPQVISDKYGENWGTR
jgi:hypothetical protein